MRRTYYRYSLASGAKKYPTRAWIAIQSAKKAAAAVVALALVIGLNLHNPLGSARNASVIQHVPGQDYLICDEQSQYLTSPWTYSALTSGRQNLTVDQYHKLNTDGTESTTAPGSAYGTTLPSLPAYILAEDPGTTAAIIFAPGATGVAAAAYNFPSTPVLYFFEGGAYPAIGLQSISGDEFIGGSAPGYPEPQFNDNNGAAGIDSGNDSYGYSGGVTTLAASASSGATTITTAGPLAAWSNFVTFSDGSTYRIASTSGTSTTLNSPLTSNESSGGSVWSSSNAPIATVSANNSQGASSLTLSSSTMPLVQWGRVSIGNDQYTLTSVSGSQSGYSIGLQGLDSAVSANTPVYYSAAAGGVTVEYLDISHDLHVTTGTIDLGTGWVVEHNKIHDSYRNQEEGVALYGGDEATVEYNCFSKMGSSGAGGAGTNDVFDYNEVYQSGFEGDPGCGCTGDKWWGSLNADIVDNAFIEVGKADGTPAIWLDNGNTGTLIEGNYFDHNGGSAIMNETGFNMKVDDNLFQDNGWGTGTGVASNSDGAVNINSSGGINIPGSRFENQVLVSNNQFVNNWMGINMWQSDQRNCLGSGEGWPDDSAYCSGGFPTTNTTMAGNQYYFSHQGNVNDGGTTTLMADASSSDTTVRVRGNVAIDDQIDFTNPSSATTTDTTTNVSAFTGSGTINVDSTNDFPSAGQLLADTSNGSHVALAYTGKSATTFTGVLLLYDPDMYGSGTLSGPIHVNDPAYTTTTDTTDVTTFNGSQSVNAITTSGFPTSGQLRVGTSAAFGDAGGGFTGAILSYTGISGNSFTGVSLVRGKGTLSGSGGNPAPIQQVQPYKVTDETCGSNDCTLTITPGLNSSESAGDEVTNAGTCSLFSTSVALPSGPLAPNGYSYWDGCQWEVKNVSVTGNTFFFQPSYIAQGTPLVGSGTSTTCANNNNNDCGTNFMASQTGGEAPYFDPTIANAMMSSSTFTGCPVWDSVCTTDPLNNINGDPNPPGVPANNGEAPANNVWASNTYVGPWYWNDVYSYSGCWPLPTDSATGNSLPQADCGAIGFNTWKSAWQQDSGSTLNPLAVSIGNLTSGQTIHGSGQTVTAYEDTQSGNTISSSLLVGTTTDSTVSTVSSSPHNFSLNTLNYHDGSYTVKVSATDSASNTNNDSVPVIIDNGDLNGDSHVNISDLAIMAAHWGQTDSNYSDGNITGQGTINISDLAVLASNWSYSH